MENDTPTKSIALPICVDLDGTLLRTDVMMEQIWRSIWKRPIALIFAFFTLFRGIACFKQKLATIISYEPMHLPFNKNFLAFLKNEYLKGRKLYLVTAADQRIAETIGKQLPIFTQIWASDGTTNLKGKNKANKLKQELGECPFIYAGNSHADLPVWLLAKEAIIVNANRLVIQQLKNTHHNPTRFDKKKNDFITLLKAIRIHQWAKNILLFIPLIIGHYYINPNYCVCIFLGFISFSFAASSAYVLNDLLDLDSDRCHHSKKNRVIASGDFALRGAIGLWVLFFIASISIAKYMIGNDFLNILFYYYTLTLSYSLYLKKQRFLDIITLIILYTLRVIAGVIALDVSLSPWLLVFFPLFFLSLILIKRYSELFKLKANHQICMEDKKYCINDMPNFKLTGLVTGGMSALILSFYIHSHNVVTLYSHPDWLWALIALLLLWVGYLWQKTVAGVMDEDPVIYTLKSKTCWIIGILAIVCLHLAF